jgi:hypothetical protein
MSRAPLSDHRITGSTDHPILTALQSFILSTIHQRGPQSEMGLWHHTKCESLKAVIIALGILAEQNLIERCRDQRNIPQRYPAGNGCPFSSWQLTQKGQEHIAALGAADVAACNAAQQ